MKPPRRSFHAVVTVSLLVLGLSHAPLRAAGDDDAAHKAAAEEVLKAMHMEGLFDRTTNMMISQVDRITDGAAGQLADKTAAADFQTRMHAQSREMLNKQFNWDSLKPEFIGSYVDIFSTQELKELATFYNSPIGQKLVSKQSELSERIGKASQERARQVLPLIVKMVRDESAKIQGPAASPAPGGGPAFPGAPPGFVPPPPPAGFVPPPPPSGFVPPPLPSGFVPPSAAPAGSAPLAPPKGFVPPAPPAGMVPPAPSAPAKTASPAPKVP